MWPEGRTIAVWLGIGIGFGLGVTVWFDRVKATYACAGSGSGGGCSVQLRHVTALHLVEGSTIGLGIGLLSLVLWIAFTFCIPKQAAVIPTKRRGRPG